ncbi:SAM-dependent methyltransferase [Acinetobacter sp. ANC 5054]|uniref:SAM-dependent methyltransferase n=1 Tax=Acinetobacter sp. ANC 5054 TaxID=1977877 RepID=UPI000A34F48D|nr:class I SAM-dependent methyltransferase [Acinetobacter sp. ANC 5054]OTG82808.1 SAM-dependent methyltransferase [Acinetobacter sp. ANC 5054]
MAKDFNLQQVVDGYDVHIRKLIPAYELVHQQIQAILDSVLEPEAHTLIIGCGTGYELNYLLAQCPTWTFTVTELSENMLHKARQQVEELRQSHRVNFVLGSHTEFEQTEQFDAVLCILVTHFIEHAEKHKFLQKAYDLLKAKGIFLSFDLMQFNSELEKLVLPKFCEKNGLSKIQTKKMMQRLADDFHLIEQKDYERLLEDMGFQSVHCFTQILSYAAYWAMKD